MPNSYPTFFLFARLKQPLFSFLLLLSFAVFGQKSALIMVSGHIFDAKTHEALPGATVVIPQSTYYGVSDVYGAYAIKNVPLGEWRLQVRMLGYTAVDTLVQVSSKSNHFDFYLPPYAVDLAAVEVVGDILKSGKKEQSLTIDVADKVFLEKNYGNTFVNTLEKIPGLTAMNTGVGIAKPVIRGLYGARVMVNDQGIKQEGQQWGTDHGLEIDQFSIEKVEVIKGPASLQYGSDALGGVVNIIAPPMPAMGKSLQAEITGLYRNNNNHLGTSVAVSGNKGHQFMKFRFSEQSFADYRVPATQFTYNGYVLPIYNNRLKNTAGNEQTISGVVGTAGKWGNVQAVVSNFAQEAGFFVGAIGIPRSYQLNTDGNLRNRDIPRQVTHHLKAIVNLKVVFNNQSINTDIGYQNNYRREESYPHLHGLGPAPQGTLAHALRLQTITLNTRYNRYYGNNLKTTAGFQMQAQHNKRGGFEFLLPNFTNLQTGIFTTAEKHFRQIMTLSGGIRLDYGKIDITRFTLPVYANDTTIIGFQERVPDINRHFYNYSAATGFSYYPNDLLNIKLNFSKSFRIPAPVEIGQYGVHHGTFRHEQGTPTLKSESGYQLDAALMLKSSHWVIEFSPYFNYFNNYIFLRPTGSFSLLPDAGQIYRYTQANAVHTGFEWQVEYHPVDAFHVETAAQYVYNVNLTSGLPLPFTPPFSVYNQADFTFPHLPAKWVKEVFIAAEHQWVAPQNRTDRNEAATPGYNLFHLATGATLGWGKYALQLNLRVQNIFNTAYMNHLSRFRILNLPEQGRNIMLTVKVPVKMW
ncbi:MAG TPA: TonB-dependent receptor [Chitinophagales bacterium]|nr:TonB-dependent receptor [Chitinophagales bacterium]